MVGENRYSSYFKIIFFKLKRMDQHPIGMMEASATLSLTITEATLQCCSVRFSWDDCVTRLESTLDLLAPLMRILGNVEDVSYVLNEAVITPEYLIGE
ncbi:Hypothetical protein PHPALM_36792, partial [Phytophthora palmivora]